MSRTIYIGRTRRSAISRFQAAQLREELIPVLAVHFPGNPTGHLAVQTVVSLAVGYAKREGLRSWLKTGEKSVPDSVREHRASSCIRKFLGGPDQSVHPRNGEAIEGAKLILEQRIVIDRGSQPGDLALPAEVEKTAPENEDEVGSQAAAVSTNGHVDLPIAWREVAVAVEKLLYALSAAS